MTLPMPLYRERSSFQSSSVVRPLDLLGFLRLNLHTPMIDPITNRDIITVQASSEFLRDLVDLGLEGMCGVKWMFRLSTSRPCLIRGFHQVSFLRSCRFFEFRRLDVPLDKGCGHTFRPEINRELCILFV